MTGWVNGESEVTLPDSGREDDGADDVRVVELLQDDRRHAGTGAGFQGTADPVVILGHGFWQRHLAADPEILGKMLTSMACRTSWPASARTVRRTSVRSDGCRTVRAARTASASPRGQQPALRPGQDVGAHPRPSVARRQRGAGKRGRFRHHIAAGQRVSGDQRVQGRRRRAVPSRAEVSRAKTLIIARPSGAS